MIKVLKNPAAKKVGWTVVGAVAAAIVLHQLRKRTSGIVDDD